MQAQQKLFHKIVFTLFWKVSTISFFLKCACFHKHALCCLAFIITFPLFSFQGAGPAASRWWRITGSNRWPPECKSGALPAELIPHITGKWWARVGSNHRPYDYQSYALASWATGPSSRVHIHHMYPQNWTMQEFEKVWPRNVTRDLWSREVSLERRWSSRSFSNGYLVTTSPQLSNPPSAAPSFSG